MSDKEKIVQYLRYKGISKNSFYKTTGLSVGFLDSGSSLGVDKLRIIIDNYQDLNPLWFFVADSDMIKTVSDTTEESDHDTYSNINQISKNYKLENRRSDFNDFITLMAKTNQVTPEVIDQLKEYVEDFDRELAYMQNVLNREKSKFRKYKEIVEGSKLI